MVVERAVPVLVAVAALAGCAVGSSSTRADDAQALTDPLTQASSAVATASIAVDLLGDDRTTPTVTDTALLDQVAVLDEAAFAVTTLVPTDPTTAGWQEAALTAVRQAQGSVVAARSWANGAGTGETAVQDALDASADRLDRLTTQLEGSS
ncbi:hypothetical protein [Cellulomonas sp. URHD0024]|uniref:hypothetical protein n=1 Tax=Cellulomonas sp. URHD0024 TaxID=1302620 RepID=UPI00048100ED|nr:hypothetical protein [Cellulomonas sp. URHD0024]